MAAGITLAACQSNTYHIVGTVENAADGDTLFLTTDIMQGIPCAKTVIKNGRFELSGETDDVRFCMIYSKNDESLTASFFLEPGRIQVSMPRDPSASRVGGTKINDEWQRMNDSVMVVAKDINRIAEKVYETESSQEEQMKAMDRIEQQNKRFSRIVINFIERNIHNELGYFLLTFYPEDIIPNKERRRLIPLLPEDMRQRDLIKQMEEYLGTSSQIEEGGVMEDFIIPSIGGSPMSLMSEVRKNRITVFDFWASWCAPCRRMMPQLKDLYKRYKDKGLGIIGISLDDDADEWKQAVEALSLPWLQICDLKGESSEVKSAFGFTKIPFIVVVDQQGNILRRRIRGHELEDFIAEQLK